MAGVEGRDVAGAVARELHMRTRRPDDAGRQFGAGNHRTAVPGVYHIGASTHPGPTLGGGSGFLLASALK